jgi:predicted nucleic acid-binding protein
MKYLLDVNALVALGIVEHNFHHSVTSWVRSLRSRSRVTLLTCSITELGFVRILSNKKAYGFTVATAGAMLHRVKVHDKDLFLFVSDGLDASKLPDWVEFSSQITDGHLAQLASEHGAALATLDRRIPGAFLIPE